MVVECFVGGKCVCMVVADVQGDRIASKSDEVVRTWSDGGTWKSGDTCVGWGSGSNTLTKDDDRGELRSGSGVSWGCMEFMGFEKLARVGGSVEGHCSFARCFERSTSQCYSMFRKPC